MLVQPDDAAWLHIWHFNLLACKAERGKILEVVISLPHSPVIASDLKSDADNNLFSELLFTPRYGVRYLLREFVDLDRVDDPLRGQFSRHDVAPACEIDRCCP